MSLPVSRPEASTPATPETVTQQPYVAPPPVAGPLGWALALGAATALLLSSWMLYSTATPDGMWSGYISQSFALVIILAALSLKVDLPAAPAIGVLFLCGIGLVLVGIFANSSTTVMVSDLSAGIVVLIAATLRTTQSR